jgi:hypothetical protein
MKRAILILALCSSCTFGVTATHPELQQTGNICASARDPRCAAFFGDMAAFTAGAIAWSRAERDGDSQYIAGATVMLSVIAGDVLAGVIWPERM